MHPLVEKYGKQPMRELMDRLIIGGKIDNVWMRFWLIKVGIINPNSKATIRVDYYKGAVWGYDESRNYGQLPGVIRHNIVAKNGRGTWLFHEEIASTEFPQIMEDLK
jgi:hypothetical protein